jgi:hypothetical protein
MLCLEFGNRFVMELPRLSRQQLAMHSRSGDRNSAFTGHPTCQFCSQKAFYNDDWLYKHLKENHESCFLCTRAGSRFQYFENYTTLQTHFAAEHFLCPEPECLDNRFCVFPTALDLHAHYATEHPGRMDHQHHRNAGLDFVIRGSHRRAGNEDDATSSQNTAQQPRLSLSMSEFPALGAAAGLGIRPTQWASNAAPSSTASLQPNEFPAIGRVSAPYDTRPPAPAAHFPALPQRAGGPRRTSAIERFEQWHNTNRDATTARGARQDAELLQQMNRKKDDDDDTSAKKAGRKKAGGKNKSSQNMARALF